MVVWYTNISTNIFYLEHNIIFIKVCIAVSWFMKHPWQMWDNIMWSPVFL